MKKITYLMGTVLCALLLFGCGGQAEAESTAEGKAAISFTDDDGVEINMEAPGERIISLYSAHTENIYYLGAGDKLIGAYKTSTFPPDAAFLDRYDYSGDPEALIAAEPDLVIIRPFVRKKAPNYVKAVENAGITVVSLYPDRLEEFDDYINKLALITGTEDKAKELLADFHGELDGIKEITSGVTDKQTIFFESTETNVRTVTPNSMAGLAIDYAGGINIAADAEPIEKGSSIAAFGEERVLMNADNIDVYVSQRGAMNSGASKQGISERAGFEAIRALKEGRLYTINEKLISSPSFRYVKGVRELARYLYPDLIDDITSYQNDDTATRRSFANIVFKRMHLPVYVPSSSSYYQTEQKKGIHTYGLFVDLDWQDKDFDAIETVVERGCIQSRLDQYDKEHFMPQEPVTRDELAQAVFVMGDFEAKENNIPIADIENSAHSRIVQILVDNGVFDLNEGCFEPERTVTNNEILRALEFVEGAER